MKKRPRSWPTFEEAASTGVDSAIAQSRNEKAPPELHSFMSRIGLPPQAILKDDCLDLGLLEKASNTRPKDGSVAIIWFYLTFTAFAFSFLSEEQQSDEYLSAVKKLATGLGLRQSEVDLVSNKVLELRGKPEVLRQNIRIALKASVINLARVRDHLAEGIQRLDMVLSNFHMFARRLTRRHASRPSFEIKDEYDVQDLLHALLAIDFSNIKPEEWAPSFGGAQGRMDFVLSDYNVVIEVKMVRHGLGQRELTEQLLVDVGKYKTHPNCDVLVVFVYDPDSLLPNPVALVEDFAKAHSISPKVLPYVVPGP